MTLEYDLPHFCAVTDAHIDPAIDAADILARYWNDRMPAGENVETISWWLRQHRKPELPPRVG